MARLDIAVAVSTMSGFRVAPRVGHLDQLKQIVGYLVKMKHGFIRVRTKEPDFSDLPSQPQDWSHTVYGKVIEMLLTDAPKPLGKPVVFTTYVDANLYHNYMTGVEERHFDRLHQVLSLTQNLITLGCKYT